MEQVTSDFKPGQLYVGCMYDFDGGITHGHLAVFGSDGEWYDADSLEPFPRFDFDFCVEQSGAFYEELAA